LQVIHVDMNGTSDIMYLYLSRFDAGVSALPSKQKYRNWMM